MNANQLKLCMARYLRYDLSCPVLALECNCRLSTSYNNGGAADILAVDKKRQLIEVEVKTSISDLRADRKKDKHEYYRKICGFPYKNTVRRWNKDLIQEPKDYPTHLFYFAVPYEIANQVVLICDELFPYAGVLTATTTSFTEVLVLRKARGLSEKKISLFQATILARSQSATLVRLLEIISNLENKNYARANG